MYPLIEIQAMKEAQWAECLLYKCEDLSSELNQHKAECGAYSKMDDVDQNPKKLLRQLV